MLNAVDGRLTPKFHWKNNWKKRNRHSEKRQQNIRRSRRLAKVAHKLFFGLGRADVLCGIKRSMSDTTALQSILFVVF